MNNHLMSDTSVQYMLYMYKIQRIRYFRLTKKSWFGALMGMEREEHHFIMIKDKPLSQVKADLIHSFLSVC